jgi:Zn-dependent protease
MNMSPEEIRILIASAPLLLFSLTIHEFAHARTALAFGDPTAKHMGRVTLNPLKHLDPIGTIMILVIRFGWAKPVPVNPHNLHPRKQGSIAVSLAGPASNLLLALFLAGLFRILFLSGVFDSDEGVFFAVVLFRGIAVNFVLFLFNLLPLFPLDGHHIVRELLPGDRQGAFMMWQMRYGQMLLLALLLIPRFVPEVPSPLGMLYTSVLGPVANWLGS